MKNFFPPGKQNFLIQMILLILFVITSSLFLPGCSSGSNVGDVVCDYGNALCDVGGTICRDIPGVPPQVCDYLDLACYNLNAICELRDPEDPKVKQALENLQAITGKLQDWKLARDKELEQKELQQE